MNADEIESVVQVCRSAGYDARTCGRTVISKLCGIKEHQARVVQTTLRQGSSFVEAAPVVATAPLDKPKATFESALASYQNWVGDNGLLVTEPWGALPAATKIVVAGDFHCPFHHKDAVYRLIDEEASTTDLLFINGDLGDFWSTSRFPKNSRLTDPCAEMAETGALLKLLASKFKRIQMIGGNHDSRPQKYLAGLLPSDVLDYIKLTGPMVFKPLTFMAAGLGNVEVVEPIRVEHAEFGFVHQIGDMACTHAETYSIIPNRATGNVNKWVHSFAIPGGVLEGPIRTIVQGHTHQGGSVLGDYGTLCIEGGCLSTLQDYHGTPKIMTPRPLAQGWTVVYQENGVTSHRHSRFIPYKH